MSSPHPGGPRFDFGVSSSRSVSFSALVEALLPLVFFRGFSFSLCLHIFESQILRKIHGPVNIDNIWRIRNHMEIDKLTEGADIVRFIKAQIIKWLAIYGEWTEQHQLGSY